MSVSRLRVGVLFPGWAQVRTPILACYAGTGAATARHYTGKLQTECKYSKQAERKNKEIAFEALIKQQ